MHRARDEPKAGAGWPHVLGAVGYEVDAPDVGCCGMAGVFRHEAGNQEMSKQLWTQSWADQVGGRGGVDLIAATGYSCRSQAKRLGDVTLLHPVDLVV